MAASAGSKSKSSAPRSRTTTSRARTSPTAVAPTAPVSDVQLSEQQEEIRDAKKATSTVEKGGVVKADFRMESEGIKSPIKADFDNPESGLIYDPASTIVAPKEPGKVTVGAGETVAQHEAHVLLSGPAVIAERLEQEAGADGLPTDVIARRRQEGVAKTEFQRVSGDAQADRAAEDAKGDNQAKRDAA